ncbi:hypothetical protein MMC09_000500 [Bachmanniomyces sp. S44760]|nr:hypothetical protein [Bachmanniomyces sp. S44760]
MRETRSSGALNPTKMIMMESDEKKPIIIILPDTASETSPIITLRHPRKLSNTRYLCCAEKGIYEFTKVTASSSSYRSLLLSPDVKYDSSKSKANAPKNKISGGYVSDSADVLVATPIDPLFLLLNPLAPKQSRTGDEPSKSHFLSPDDIFESVCDDSKDGHQLFKHPKIRKIFEHRLEVACDTVDAGGEKMYRLNMEKLCTEMLKKARRMVAQGLPASIEAHFIQKALEEPVLAMPYHEDKSPITCDESSEDLMKSERKEPEHSTLEATDSQSSVSSLESSNSITSASTPLTEPDQKSSPSEEILRLLRIRTAFTFVTSSYAPPSLSRTLYSLLSNSRSIDFTPLDTHLSHLASLRATALASRSLSDFSRKRSMYEDDETNESRADKKRKKEEEEKRKKAGMSRGVRDLKKADTSGMKKMSSFFGKKGP